MSNLALLRANKGVATRSNEKTIIVIESKTLMIVSLVEAKVIIGAPSLHCYCPKIVQVTLEIEFRTKPEGKAKTTKNGKKLSYKLAFRNIVDVVNIYRQCKLKSD